LLYQLSYVGAHVGIPCGPSVRRDHSPLRAWGSTAYVREIVAFRGGWHFGVGWDWRYRVA